MKKILDFTFIFFAILALSSGCEETTEPVPVVGEGLEGTWKLYEYGYSPGDEYIIQPVAAYPSQLIILYDNKISTNLNELNDYKFYKILEDPHTSQPILALFKTQVEFENADPARLEHSYMMELSEAKLKLSYRFCFEGCHLAFKRTATAESGGL
jgi:hypothetical protein